MDRAVNRRDARAAGEGGGRGPRRSGRPRAAPDTPIELSEQDGVRYLHFGSPWIQGAMRLRRPFDLELDYVRHMMAWLLFMAPPARVLQHDERIEISDGVALRVVHTPGHAANHLCLVLEEDRLLFSGDHVLNGSTTVVNPPDGDMDDYLASLERLAAEPVDFILPAHGHVLAPAVGAMRKLIAHRLAREAKVAAVLARVGGGTLDELVPFAYDDVRPALFPVAKRSLLAHLERLEKVGRASRDAERWAPR